AGGALAYAGLIDEVKLHAQVLAPGNFNLLPAAMLDHTVGLTGESDRIGILAVPNPVGDSGAFVAEGSAITSLRVWVFAASGEQVFDSGWHQSTYIVWNGENDYGDRLANGFYIYVAAAQLAAGIVHSFPPATVFILR
ncbi:hypothetical protein KAJ02_01515, partial [Candidatus Bipolaricaulota bacterium]|nr:hypothetical protein [Candidatus Bipolaricaulota bacterium]